MKDRFYRVLSVVLTAVAVLAVVGCGKNNLAQIDSTAYVPAEPSISQTEEDREIFAAIAPPDEPVEDITAGWDGENVILTWSTRPMGDVNKDNEISGMDVFPLAAHFSHVSSHDGNQATDPDDDCIDVNKDGIVSGLDLFVVAANFQEGIDNTRIYYSADGLDFSPLLLYPATTDPPLHSGTCPRTYNWVSTSHGLGDHWFKVRLEGGGTEGPESAATHVTGTAIPPEAPGNVTIDPVLAAIGIYWDPAWGAAGYNVYRDTVPFIDLDPGRLLTPSPLGREDQDYLDEGILPDQTFFYRVSAVNIHGESPGSDQVQGEAGGPEPPASLTADGKNGRVELEWSGVGSVDGYNVYRDDQAFLDLTPVRFLATIDKRDTEYIDGGLENGSTFYYRVSAFIGDFESEGSPLADGTPVQTNFIWNFDTVEQGSPGDWMAMQVSVAQKSNGSPAATYHNRTDNNSLKFAEYSGLNWETEKVDERDLDISLFIAGQYSSLAFDANDRPGIAYQVNKYVFEDWDPEIITFATAELRYAHKTSRWNIETVDDGAWYSTLFYPEPGRFNVLVFNGNIPLIVSAFQIGDLYNGETDWYYKPSTTWDWGTIGPAISRTSGVVSAGNHPYFFGYENDVGLQLFDPQAFEMLNFNWNFAPYSGGGRSTTQFEAGLSPEATVDPIGGMIYLVHYHEDLGLFQSLYDPLFGQVLSEALIAPGPECGMFSDIAFSNSGTLGVCYWDSELSAVRFGVWNTSSHTYDFKTIDQGPGIGRECNLVWIGEDPMIIYTDVSTGILKAARGMEE